MARSLTRIGLLTLLLAALMGCSESEIVPHEPKPSIVALELGSPIEAQIDGGESHIYAVSLEQNAFAELLVEQKGIDVEVHWTDPSGSPELVVDSPLGDRGAEVVPVLARSEGLHRFEIRAFDKQHAGNYSVQLIARRPANEPDRARERAARAMFLGDRMAREKHQEVLLEALEAFQQAAELWHLTADFHGEALARRSVARIHARLKNHDAELAAYLAALEAARNGNAYRIAAILLDRLGMLHLRDGDPEKALERFQEARRHFEQLRDPLRQARMLSRIGTAYRRMGSTQEAIRIYLQALERFVVLEDPEPLAMTRYNLGQAYVRLAQYDLALDQFLPLRELRRRNGQAGEEVLVLNGIGKAYRRQGHLEPARQHFQEAIEILHGMDESVRRRNRRREAIVLNGLAQTFFKLGKPEQALPLYEEALALAIEIKSSQLEGPIRVNLGWFHETRDALDKALSHYNAAVPLLEQHKDSYLLASAWIGLAKTERKRGRLDNAISHTRRAIAEVESLRGSSDVPWFQASYFATKKTYYEILIDQLVELDQQETAVQQGVEALRVSGQSRARSLLDAVVEARQDFRPDAPADLKHREHQLRQQLQAAEMEWLRVNRGQAPATRRGEVEQEMRSILNQFRDVQGLLRGYSRDREATGTEFRSLDLAEIQQEILDPQTVLLEYSLGEARSFLWRIDTDSVETHVLPGRSRIEALARRTHRGLVNSHLPGVGSLSNLHLAELGEMLLGPIASTLRDKRLVIVADGALQYIPFAALVVDKTDPQSRPLIEDHEIVHLPSVAVLKALREVAANRDPAPSDLAILADPVFGKRDPRVSAAHPASNSNPPLTRGELEPYDRLPAAADEAQALYLLVEPGRSLRATGFDANLDLVRSGTLADYRILHFATHGRSHSESPELSGIALSMVDTAGQPRDGMLYAHEIYGLRLQADLVVLSACETALGRELKGEGMVNLTHSFHHAGAIRVVVSLWQVNDRATTELMRRFYEGLLRDDLSPAAALRAAQRTMRANPRWQAPYYWSSFLLNGDWR